MALHEDVKALIKKHSYEVVVFAEKSHPNIIKTVFPERKERPFCEETSETYWFLGDSEEDNTPGLFISTNEEEYSFLECPQYAFEEIIFSNIEKACEIIGYDRNLIFFYLDESQVTLKQFKKESFDIKLNRTEFLRKRQLSKLINDARLKGFSCSDFFILAEKNSMEYPYEIIKAIWEA